MNGAPPPLSNQLITNMRPQQPPPPQAGGLEQMNGAPPQMAKQGTDMALAALNREDTLEPGLTGAANIGWQQYVSQMQELLRESLPSQGEIRRSKMARGLLMDNALSSMAPKQYSGMDNMAAGITSYNKPIMQGDLGAALASMGQGAVGARDKFEKHEQAKALASYDMVDKEYDQQQKLMTDAITKGSKLQQQSTGKWVPVTGEPGVFVNNVTSERKVISNADALAIRDLTGKLVASNKFESPQDALDAAIQMHYSMMPQGAAAPGKAPAGLAPPNNAAGAPVPPPMAQNPAMTGQMPPPMAPQATPELARPSASTPANAPGGLNVPVGSPEGYDLLRKMMNEASRSGDRQKFDALMVEMRKSYPGGNPTRPSATQVLTGQDQPSRWPQTLEQKREAASATSFTVTPQEAVLQGVPYIPSIYDKFTDPKRREDAAKDFQKQWQEWQEKKMPAFQAAGEAGTDLKRFLDLQAVNKGTDAGVYDVLPFVTDIRSRMNPHLQEMQSISNKLALKMREAGTGAMSDKDLAVFQQSTIGVDKKPEANANMIALAQANLARVDAYRKFASKMNEVYRFVDPSKIDSLWKEYANANPIYGGTDKKTGQVIINKPVPAERWFNQNRKD
jgi:hypothetical protein